MNPFAKGTVLALLTIGIALLLPEDLVVPFFALLLSFVAAVYVGFAETDLESQETRLQWGVALGFLGVALLGLRISPWILVIGWALHTGWDFLHHRTLLNTRTSDWYPRACLAYDLIIAGFLAYWIWPTG